MNIKDLKKLYKKAKKLECNTFFISEKVYKDFKKYEKKINKVYYEE